MNEIDQYEPNSQPYCYTRRQNIRWYGVVILMIDGCTAIGFLVSLLSGIDILIGIMAGGVAALILFHATMDRIDEYIRSFK
jgi:membrane protein YqaA with SNARE-associated domain